MQINPDSSNICFYILEPFLFYGSLYEPLSSPIFLGSQKVGVYKVNETDNSNENTNLRELADQCQRSVAVGDIATEALSVSLESLLTSDIRITSLPEPKATAKCSFSPNSMATKR